MVRDSTPLFPQQQHRPAANAAFLDLFTTLSAAPTAAATLLATAVALATAASAHLCALAWLCLENISACYVSCRYFTGPACWLLYGFVFWRQPVLRLPLLLYHTWIISPWGSKAVGTNRWPWLLRNNPFYWGLLGYFKGSKLVKTADLDPGRRYVFCGHPHGLLGNAFCLAFLTDLLGFTKLFPGIRLSVGILNLNLRVSFCREICLLHGCTDVDRRNLLRRLTQGPGSAVFLAVGGAREALLTQPGRMDLILNKRKGFVKLALQAGADLVPVLAFGENDQYYRAHIRPKGLLLTLVWLFQQAVHKVFGFFPVPEGYGVGVLNVKYGPLPKRIPLTVVVGAPIRLPDFQGDFGSAEGRALVDACHQCYCQALLALYDQHKEQYAPDRLADMQLVE